jgi:nucleoside-diphosphate-sugar epimerase
MDAVVDLAALSNDPAGALDPWKTFDINYLGRIRVARIAKEAGVKRYILFSSCSVYGFQDGLLNEKSPTIPLTAYARANLLAEADNLALNSEGFTSTVLRFATVYGLSKRMRFDLAINGMVLGAVKNTKIPLMRDGSQWRPFIHVKDVAAAVLQVLGADPSTVGGQVINIGSDAQNYQIRNLGELVAASVSTHPPIEWYGDPDTRSYRVSFSKASDLLGFQPSHTPQMAAQEIEEALRNGSISEGEQTITVNWYKRLLSDRDASDRVALRGVVL